MEGTESTEDQKDAITDLPSAVVYFSVWENEMER